MNCRWGLLLIAGMLALPQTHDRVSGDDAEQLRKLCDAFEKARVCGNANVATKLVLPSASVFGRLGGARRKLLSDLRFGARWLENSGKKKLEPVRVVSRRVAVEGPAAVVTELLGAAQDVRPNQSVTPRRRTLLWLKTDGGWKIAHVHESAYSRWEAAIKKFEAQDKEQPVASGGMVFVGSSSIVGWRGLSKDFPDAGTVRRGFGGSQMIDSVLYAHRIVTRYQPRAVAVYAGDNDIAVGKTPQRVFRDFQLFVKTVHATSPQANIGFIAIKPSLARWKLWPRMKKANGLVRQFAERHDRIAFLDIATPMFAADGKPNPQLFLKDGLHLNVSGYALWKDALRGWVASQ